LSVRRWFENNISRKISNSKQKSFWKDKWLNEIPLTIRFSRLFDLIVDKNILMMYMYIKGWGVGGEGWRWRQCHFA
jgi:hypothetical protein